MKVYDFHCDSILTLDEKSSPISKYNFSSQYPHFQVFAVFVDDRALNSQRELAFSYIDKFRNSFDGVVALDSESYLSAKNARHGALISLEGTSFIDSTRLLDSLYEKGVRSLCISWNNVSRICATNLQSGKNDDFGISPFGKEIVSHAAKLGMILDVSHLSDRGFFDLLELTDKPFIASHSNLRSIGRHPRNLLEEEAAEIIKRRGIIGLNIFPPFVSDVDDFNDFFRHIDRFLEIGAEDVLSFGFDIDGTSGLYFNEIPKFVSIHDYFISVLTERYGVGLVEKLAYKNAERFLDSYFDV